ncbi:MULTISPECIES: MATE family efflux transporter [unclassified Photobacterium]|uniref:MATE family efflux transporter n=1 Tax=unclassified Photobacterium TaxID=2628852 RepID=UPI001EDDCE7D|nr:MULTISPECIES: MATE family efflux transporter [unclassified Photobacterium]MCG3865511.1 MATE family efflux transporter [Photobacterium sp. Ph6]MCG3877010.1 MATE family efflux transporter [Photobacterium sp. Ph5]
MHTLNRTFFSRLFFIATPIILQSILFSSKGLIDILMLSQLSEIDIAAMGIAAKALFVITILLTGIATGGGILSAQYWGANNHLGVKKSTVLSIFCTVIFAFIFALIFYFYPHAVMLLASSSEAVINRGSEYLTIVGFSLIFSAIVVSYTASLRSIGEPKVSTIFSACGIVCNIFFNWILIFGYLGFPALGIKGAALATLLSSMVEVVLLLTYLYLKKHILTFKLADFSVIFSTYDLQRFFALSLPTTFNFLLWSVGIFSYHAIMGMTGVEGLAALSVMTPIESLSLSFLVGVANASAVIIGNQLGAKHYHTAYYQAIALVVIAIIVTCVISVILFLMRDNILSLFPALTIETKALASNFMAILSIGIILRSLPTTMVVGVLRAGGDVKFCLYQDVLTQWAFGIPLAFAGAYFFNLSPVWVFSLFFAETLFKWFACIYRFRSKKWLNNLI